MGEDLGVVLAVEWLQSGIRLQRVASKGMKKIKNCLQRKKKKP